MQVDSNQSPTGDGTYRPIEIFYLIDQGQISQSAERSEVKEKRCPSNFKIVTQVARLRSKLSFVRLQVILRFADLICRSQHTEEIPRRWTLAQSMDF